MSKTNVVRELSVRGNEAIRILGPAVSFPGAPAHTDGLAAYASWTFDAARDEAEPSAPWVPARLLRGSSRLTRLLSDVAARAVQSASADPAEVATFYTSSFGEIDTMVQLLDTIFRGDGQLSPMRFKNSVHNAASGLGSIGRTNTAFSTALAAGERSFEAAVLEAIAYLGTTDAAQDAVIACADDVVPPPFDGAMHREPLGTGVVLSRGGARGLLVASIERGTEPVALPPTILGHAVSPALRANPAAHGLPLLDALVRGDDARVPLAFDVERPFILRLVRDREAAL